jgi:microcystin-dependent protein
VSVLVPAFNEEAALPAEGAIVEGTGVLLGTTIVTINSATSMTVSNTISGGSAGVALRIFPYGQGDGSTSFNVPDRRFRAAVGRDDINNNNAGRSSAFLGKRLNTAGGEETHILTTAEIASHFHNGGTAGESALHTHTYVDTTGGGQSWNGGNSVVASIGRDAAFTGTTSTQDVTHTHDFTTDPAGSGASHDNMLPFGVTNYIIKT